MPRSLSCCCWRFLFKLDSSFGLLQGLATLLVCCVALAADGTGVCDPGAGERPKLTLSLLCLLLPRSAFLSAEAVGPAASRREKDFFLPALVPLVAFAESWLLLRPRLLRWPSLRPSCRCTGRGSCRTWRAEAWDFRSLVPASLRWPWGTSRQLPSFRARQGSGERDFDPQGPEIALPLALGRACSTDA